MSAIKYALDRVMLRVPKKVLDLAFMSKSKFYGIETTLTKQLTDLIIEGIVLVDCDLIGGITLTLPLRNCNVTLYENNYTDYNKVIFIPYELTNGKKVITPISVTNNPTYSSLHNRNAEVLKNYTEKIFYHTADVSMSGTYTDLELIAPNTILLHDMLQFDTNSYIRVIVENNKNLSNIKPSAYRLFSDIVVLATQTYIYNKLIIQLEEGSLYYGHEIGVVSDIINGYEGAYEEYTELLNEKWSKIMFMNNDVDYARFIQGLVNPTI